MDFHFAGFEVFAQVWSENLTENDIANKMYALQCLLVFLVIFTTYLNVHATILEWQQRIEINVNNKKVIFNKFKPFPPLEFYQNQILFFFLISDLIKLKRIWGRILRKYEVNFKEIWREYKRNLKGFEDLNIIWSYFKSIV